MRLIDADALFAKAELLNKRERRAVQGALLVSPTIEAEPVRHGRWEKTEEPLGWQEVDCIECSVCHESWVASEDYGFDFLDFRKYCPNCGAKMDGDSHA